MTALFDPLGFLPPYIICMKIILQELWRNGLGWDDVLPGQHTVKGEIWFDELKELLSIQFSRYLKKNSKEKEKPIHIFQMHPVRHMVQWLISNLCVNQGEQRPDGAVTYQQCVCQSGGVPSCLVMPKAIVATLKLISIKVNQHTSACVTVSDPWI